MKEFCFTLTQGTDYMFKVLAMDAVANTLNFSGYSFKMQLKKSEYSTVVEDTLSTENGRITIDDDNQHITVNFPNEETQTYPVGTLVYDLIATSSRGMVYSILRGKVNVLAGITDAM